jgi:uncharacterized protein YprB with RNaseH-like and TPR domain
MRPENLLFIDIETVSISATYEELSEKMKALWDKKSQLLDKEQTNTAASYIEKAGIYAEFGKIICIGLGYFTMVEDNYHLKVKSIYGHDEKSILLAFKEVCDTFFKRSEKQFCGHNIREFDIPYLCRRAIIQQVPMPTILEELQAKKPWENPMLDTMQYWKFGEYKHFTSVDLLATILGIESPKGDIDGSDVGQVYWQEKNLERIVRYCNKDIVTVAQLWLRLSGLPLLNEYDMDIINH